MLPSSIAGISSEEIDDNFKQAVEVVVHYDRASASLLQRRLSIGYARAARLIDQLEVAGVLSSAEGSAPREKLIFEFRTIGCFAITINFAETACKQMMLSDSNFFPIGKLNSQAKVPSFKQDTTDQLQLHFGYVVNNIIKACAGNRAYKITSFPFTRPGNLLSREYAIVSAG